MNAHASRPARPIRELRLARGISQERLAREVDCSTGYIRVLERGYAPDPDSPVFGRVVEFLENDERRPAQSAAVQESVRQDRHEPS
ncbi:MAG: helix-turn-helix transcriptional regulator [Solirubrobacterales bacterium]